MSSFATYLENKVLNHIFNKASFTIPTIHVALFTALSDVQGEAGAGGTEVSGGDYARVATIGSDWTEATTGTLSNATAIEFTEASGDWGTVTHFALFDAVSGGNMLCFGTLTASKEVSSGDTIKFPISNLDVSLD